MVYAARLTGRLPRTAAGTRTGPATVTSSDWQVKMDAGEAAVICNIICTADYCQTCVGDLGRFVAKILTPPLGDKVGLACVWCPRSQACCAWHDGAQLCSLL